MKEIPTTPRIFLAVAGATSLLNTSVFLELNNQETPPSTFKVLLTLTFATLSFVNGLMLIFAAWKLPRLLDNSVGFIKLSLWMRYGLILLQYLPPALAGSMLPISLIILWTGVILYMIRSLHDLAEQQKNA